jgi:hypothetical protein
MSLRCRQHADCSALPGALDEHNTLDQAYNAQQWTVPDHTDTTIPTPPAAMQVAPTPQAHRGFATAAASRVLDHSPKMGFALPSLPDITLPPCRNHLPGM